MGVKRSQTARGMGALCATGGQWGPCFQAPPLPETHNAACEADAYEAGADVLPDADAALADDLSSRQFQEEKWDPDDEEEQQI